MAVMFAATRLRPDVDDRLLLGASRPAALRVRFPGRECLDLVVSGRSDLILRIHNRLSL